jgi:hypothetical protein
VELLAKGFEDRQTSHTLKDGSFFFSESPMSGLVISLFEKIMGAAAKTESSGL